jgi:hypothetical protein
MITCYYAQGRLTAHILHASPQPTTHSPRGVDKSSGYSQWGFIFNSWTTVDCREIQINQDIDKKQSFILVQGK